MRKTILVSLLALACATKVPAPAAPAVNAEALVDHEGNSPQTAVVVPADAPEGGVVFENQWLIERFGKFERRGGGTGVLEGRRYDVIDIVLPGGEKKKIYFDITENWNSWRP